MVAEVFAGIGAIKTAFEIAKGLKEIDDATRRNAAVIELQEKILLAQETQSTLINRVGELEKEVDRFKSWEADKGRYQLVDIGSGVVALALRPAASNGEPPHYICADCAANGKKSYLQPQIRGAYLDQYKCNACGFDVSIDKGTPPQPEWQSIEDD